MNPESGSCGIMQIIEPSYAWCDIAAQIPALSAACARHVTAAMGLRWAMQGLLECYDQPLRADLGGGYFAVPR